MDVKAKLYLVSGEGEKFMGIGVLWLLQQIEESGSLRAAAGSMGISYSKAYNMVKNLEHQIGVPVIERKRGGADHEGSSLTRFGQQFVVLYDEFQTEAKRRLVEPFDVFSREFQALLSEFAHTDKE
ncbi:MAG TPA: LysR family transcriptional regulator [Sphaerochaetaceae bacterium]|jgi:molybdate transport system regulatory protein|nr:LysR family transcriptional regulator [Sphaerochaetaceae bacterium]